MNEDQPLDSQTAVKTLLSLSGLQVNDNDLETLVQMYGWFAAQKMPMSETVLEQTEPTTVFMLTPPEANSDAE